MIRQPYSFERGAKELERIEDSIGADVICAWMAFWFQERSKDARRSPAQREQNARWSRVLAEAADNLSD